MTEDAEWIDVNKEWGVAQARPRQPRSTTTGRPFWVTTSVTRPRNPYPGTPDNPYNPGNPNNPGNPHNPGNPYNPGNRSDGVPPHDAPERAEPSVSSGSGNVILFGVVGGVMGVALVGLLLYMFVLRKRLNKAQSTRRNQEDYSIRVEDVAHMSNPLDNSSQLYVNTSDLHKLVSSVKGVRKHPPPSTPTIELAGRPKCPIPTENNHVKSNNTDVERRVKYSLKDGLRSNSVNGGLSRLSGKFTAIGVNIQNTWRQARAFRGSSTAQPNVGFESSMPDIVPDVIEDDDDIWSEDSFDSCSIGYEDETGYPNSRQGSTRRSLRQNCLNESTRKKSNNTKSKRINPPAFPPPPPPTKSSAETDIRNESSFATGTSTSQDRSSAVNHEYTVVRKAPGPPVGVKKTSVHGSRNTEDSQSMYTNNKNSKPQPGKLSSTISNLQYPPLPSLPKPVATIKPDTLRVKPVPPSGPKPTAKPHLLPKLKMGLRVPAGSAGPTPDTAISVLSATPQAEENYLGTKSAKNIHCFENATKQQPAENQYEEVEPCNLSISARKALLEKMTLPLTPKTQRQ